MFTYPCRQGCPLLTQIKWKNGRSKAISWGTLPVLKWTICSKVCESSELGAVRQLCNTQPCSGNVLGVGISELNPKRAPASASSATHTGSSARGSLWLVGIWGLAERRWKGTHGVGKATPKSFPNALCKRRWKIKGQDSGINNISPQHNGILLEWKTLAFAAQLQLLSWMDRGRQREEIGVLSPQNQTWGVTTSSIQLLECFISTWLTFLHAKTEHAHLDCLLDKRLLREW